MSRDGSYSPCVKIFLPVYLCDNASEINCFLVCKILVHVLNFSYLRGYAGLCIFEAIKVSRVLNVGYLSF